MARPLVGRRRSAIEILFEIISLCGNGGVNKTSIMYRSNLSYEQLCRYLVFLKRQGLLLGDEEGIFRATAKGHEILRQIEGVLVLLRGLAPDEDGEFEAGVQ